MDELSKIEAVLTEAVDEYKAEHSEFIGCLDNFVARVLDDNQTFKVF